MSDTTPEAVAERVAEYRRLAYTGPLTALTDDRNRALFQSCDLIEALAAEVADLEHTFTLRYAADMRAIAAWRKAGPGRKLRQPGHTDLCVWLLAEHDRHSAATKAAIEHVEIERDTAIARAERAEAALRDDVAAQYRAAFAADAAARARLADERAGIPPTERDRRGVPLGTGAGVGGGAL